LFAPSEIAKFLKGDSSRWIHQEFANLHKFAWQDGYSSFSISKSNVPAVVSFVGTVIAIPAVVAIPAVSWNT
jgi:hypothetical protein